MLITAEKATLPNVAMAINEDRDMPNENRDTG